MVMGGAGWRIFHGYQDERGGRYIIVSDYDEIRDYAASRRLRSELLEKYPQLRDDSGPA